ncbi:MAG TPA: hypothetical protein VFW00_14605 [Rhodocyclaceae bacterium]|nr:hypothetical protein [Rhodocyclaceae bacterium]
MQPAMNPPADARAPEHKHLFSNNRKTRRPPTKLQLFFRRTLSALLLAALMTALVAQSLNWLPDMWAAVVRFWLPRLGVGAEPLLGAHTLYANWIVRQLAIHVPISAPTSTNMLAHALATAALFLMSLALVRKHVAIAHLLRVFCVVHVIGLTVFAFGGGNTSVAAHTLGLYDFNIALMLLTPSILAVGFYLYEGSLSRRIAGSLLILAYLAIALPFKLVMHVWLIKLLTPLAMPTLYLLFGPAFDIFLLVCIYAYVVAWQRHSLPQPASPAAAVS